MKNSYRNPFSGVNAVQLTEDKILEYWCNPFRYDLFSEIKEEDIYGDSMNIVLMGGRSTGKSMFLRYWSFPVQLKICENEKTSLAQVILKNQGIGYYFRIDGAKLKSFQGHGLDTEHWTAVFIHYFELIVGRQYIEVLKLLQKDGEFDDNLDSAFLPQLIKLLDFSDCKSLDDVITEFDTRIKEVEVYLGNVPFYKKAFSPINRGFLSQSLSFGIPELLFTHVPAFKKLNIIILLDEYENFLEYQQKVVNTLLRFTKPQIKFRIGMRLEGFRTFEMISADDFIKEGREYRKVVFEEVLNKESGYHDFLAAIAAKRLESIPALKDKNFTDIKSILGNSENLEEEARELAKSKPEKVLDSFSKKISKEDLDKIKYPENPLLELLNGVWLMRGVSAVETAKAMNDYLSKTKTEIGEKYRRDYIDKYKLTLMFLLCTVYRKNKSYYSFNTFAFLSSGIVGHFIELCRRSFAIADWGDNEKLLSQGTIKKEFQTKAALEFSISEKQQIGRIETYGGQISRFIDNIGNIFRAYHTDLQMRYPETNQFAINIDSVQNKEMQNALRAAIKWTIIQRKPKMQRSAPSESLNDIYTLNRILSPAFQISYRTRGGKSVLLNETSLKDLMYSDKINISEYTPSDEPANKNDKKNNSPDLFSET